MFTKGTAFVAILAAVAQASMEAVPVVDQKQNGPVVAQPQHVPGNSSYVLPSLSVTGAPSSHAPASSTPSALGSVKSSNSAVATPSVGYSSSASAGYPSYSNSSAPSITLGPKIVTEIVTSTITSCPVTTTVGSGASQTVSTYYTQSTVTSTRTITVCDKCVEQTPKTSGAPGSSGDEKSPAQPGKPGEEKITQTITSTAAGGSTVVVTVTSTRTKTLTNTHTATATAAASGSPEKGAKADTGNGAVTATEKIYRTSTLYVTEGAQSTCPPQVTVTVSVPDVTVTVTAGAEPSKAAGGKEGGKEGSKEGSGDKESKPSDNASPSVTSAAPFGNGTHPYTSTKCKSTGFITKPYPSASDLFPVASAHA